MKISTEILYNYYQKHPKVVTDTRKIEPGCLFFALKGDKHDGNAFAADALEKGAAYAVIDNADFAKGEKYLLVADVLSSLQDLARHYRRTFHIPVIAITGTNGKTTTKELTASVMSMQHSTHATVGNYNNHIGVPLTLLAMPKETEIAIIEMGANHPGDIKELCEIAEPTHGLITNIGRAHLEGFGSLDGVKQTKAELYRYLASNNGLVFVNKDEKYLKTLSNPCKKRVFYTLSSEPNRENIPIEVRLLAKSPFISVQFLDKAGAPVEVHTHLAGGYNMGNIMTAIALGKYFKVSPLQIKTGLERYVPANNRSQINNIGTNTVIMDCYNANPSSMALALQSFSEIEAPLKWVILGDMLELGKESEKEHKKILSQATKIPRTILITVGAEFGKISSPKRLQHFEDTAALKVWYQQNAPQYTWILLKGSRGIKLEDLFPREVLN